MKLVAPSIWTRLLPSRLLPLHPGPGALIDVYTDDQPPGVVQEANSHGVDRGAIYRRQYPALSG